MSKTSIVGFTIVALLWAAVLVSANFQPSPVRVEAKTSVEMSGLTLIRPDTQARIDRGLKWLASQQQTNGAFGSGLEYRGNVGVTALCGMAFLSAGNTPGRGPYGKQVQLAIDYLLGNAKSSGFIINERYQSYGPMYGHGFATLFLAEVYGMSPNEKVREVLQNAVTLIINTQNKEGGWRYKPEPQVGDISVTVCQMMALRAARNAGIHVPKSTVDRCVGFVKRCQNADGGFRYQISSRPDSVFPRSAAAVVALYNSGLVDDPAVERGLSYLIRYLPRGRIFRSGSYYYYGNYYAVQAMWHAGGKYWDDWYPAIRDELIARQTPDGAWLSTAYSHEYSTAMALLVLQLPNNYLPIFQR